MALHWIDIGSKARIELAAKTPHGAHQQRMSEVASRLGTTRQVLRNILLAYDFLVEVKTSPDQAGATVLETLPYPAVMVMRRWAERDADEAARFTNGLADRRLSVREITAAEQASRRRSQHPQSSLLQQTTELAAQMLDQENVRRHLESLGMSGLPWNRADIGFIKDPVDRAFGITEKLAFPFDGKRWDQFWPNVMGFMRLAPRNLSDAFRKDAKLVFSKAVAATLLYPVTIVIAPSRPALLELIAGLPEPVAAGMDRDDSRPVHIGFIFPLMEGAGAIVLTHMD